MSQNPWPTTDPSAFWRQWSGLFAPQNLVQPILPNWTFNINTQNSSAPQTEAAVVQHHSYGRQIGRMSEVLHELIKEQDAAFARRKPVGEFLRMHRQIEQLKLDAATTRVKRLQEDLALLEKERPQEYTALRDALLQALGR